MKSGRQGAPTLARDILFFVLRFLAISIALYVLFYLFVGPYYVRLVTLIAGPMLSVFGHSIVLRGVQRIAEDISFNPIVFISLAAAVGRIPWRPRLRGMAIGTAILVVANALTVTLVFVASYRRSEAWWTGAEILDLTNNFFLPILLWLALLPLRAAFPMKRRLDGAGVSGSASRTDPSNDPR